MCVYVCAGGVQGVKGVVVMVTTLRLPSGDTGVTLEHGEFLSVSVCLTFLTTDQQFDWFLEA